MWNDLHSKAKSIYSRELDLYIYIKTVLRTTYLLIQTRNWWFLNIFCLYINFNCKSLQNYIRCFWILIVLILMYRGLMYILTNERNIFKPLWYNFLFIKWRHRYLHLWGYGKYVTVYFLVTHLHLYNNS